MIRYHAAWVVPIGQPPLRDGWVAVKGDRIVSCGSRVSASSPDGPVRQVDLGAVAIMPGLVNAHTHLELSYLRGHIPADKSFVDWIRALLAARREHPNPRAPEILGAMSGGIAEAIACGTALVGDIGNTMISPSLLAANRLAGVVFNELIGFSPRDPDAFVEAAQNSLEALTVADGVRVSLAAHAPYSVSPRILKAIRRLLDQQRLSVVSVHLAESSEESEFMRTAGGPWRSLLEDLGVWDPSWVAPGGTPVEYLDACGFLGPEILAVHGVQATGSDLASLLTRGVTLVTCPRSNECTGAGTPPISEFYKSGVRIAVGTDSLASTPDLNVFSELAAMRALAPSVPARALLESATRHGAEALGFGADYGTIAPGRRARLLAVHVPPGIGDVEEYLVSGITPSQMQWIE